MNTETEDEGCPCDACACERASFSPSEVVVDTDAAAAACANAEIIRHVAEGTKVGKRWGRPSRWSGFAADLSSLDGDLIKLRAVYIDLDDEEFSTLLETSRARFERRFCEILAKHYARVLA